MTLAFDKLTAKSIDMHFFVEVLILLTIFSKLFYTCWRLLSFTWIISGFLELHIIYNKFHTIPNHSMQPTLSWYYITICPMRYEQCSSVGWCSLFISWVCQLNHVIYLFIFLEYLGETGGIIRLTLHQGISLYGFGKRGWVSKRIKMQQSSNRA